MRVDGVASIFAGAASSANATTRAAATTGGSLLSRIPAPVRIGGVVALAALGAALVLGALHRTGIIGTAAPFPQLDVDDARRGAADLESRRASERAVAAWNALNDTSRPGTSMPSPQATGLYRQFASLGQPWTGSVWQLSQIQAGALNLAKLTGDDEPLHVLDRQMQRYLHQGGFQPLVDPIPGWDPRGHEHYSDDNMAIGLNYVQQFDQTGDAAALDRAESLVDFLMTMEDDTGLNWRTGSRAYVADSITGAQKLALLVAERRPERREQFVAFARRLEQFQEQHLRVHDGDRAGLVRDNVMSNNETAGWSDAIFSYNEGWTIGADVEWWRLTGDRTYLDRARRTADATIRYYTETDRGGLWRQPPSFNANFFENLLLLDRVDPPSAGAERPYDYRQVFDDYLDRAWRDGRDPETGFFNQGGIGGYEGPGVHIRPGVDMNPIDQGAMVQMYALRAMDDAQRESVH